MVCTLCLKASHEAIKCPDRKGCSKCSKPTVHPTKGCEEPYPAYNNQVCDECLDKSHSADVCPSMIGKCCEICGHGDHNKRTCPFGLKGKLRVDLTDDEIDQFTPKKRSAHLEKIPTKSSVAESSSAPSKPAFKTTSGQKLPIISAIPKVSSAGSATDSTSVVQGGTSSAAETGLESRTSNTRAPEITEAVLNDWQAAENSMPRPLTNALQIAEGTSKDEILANFFVVTLDANKKLHRYAIILGDTFDWKRDNEPSKLTKESGNGNAEKLDPEMKPEQKRKLKRETKRYLIEQLLKQNRPKHDNWACDFDSTIISVGELYPGSSKAVGQETLTTHILDPKKPGSPGRPVDSYVRFLGNVESLKLKNHVDGKDHTFNPDAALKALNIISWRKIYGTFVGGEIQKIAGGVIGKKFYPESLLDGKREQFGLANDPFLIRGGFFTSMRPGQGNILLNVNTATSAFYTPVSVAIWIDRFFGRGYHPSSYEFKRWLKNIRVTFSLHKGGRKWVIFDISSERVSQTTFEKHKGDQDRGIPPTRVSDYLEMTYPGQGIDPNDLCINVGNSKKSIWYPAKKLNIVDWQIVTKKLPDPWGDEMIKYAALKPQQVRTMILGDARTHLGMTDVTPFYKDFGVAITADRFLRIKKNFSSPPRLIFDSSVKNKVEVRNGAWILAGLKFSEPIQVSSALDKLSIISFAGAIPEGRTQLLRDSFSSYGLVQSPRPVDQSVELAAEPRFPRDISYRTDCVGRLNTALAHLKPTPAILLVVLREKSIDLYAEVKWWGDCVVGIPTVCITADKLRGAAASHVMCANICLKFSLKLRGVSHKLQPKTDASSMTGAKSSTMIVGADCTHPADHAQGCPSIAAVVATDDETSSHYLGSARLQGSKQEYIDDLRGMIKERVLVWSKKSAGKGTKFPATLPKNILFYRDGVSESQYGMVRHQELPQIKQGFQDALAELEKQRLKSLAKAPVLNPKITLLVVTKRHHARFFTSIEGDSNLPAGTVADNRVVAPNQIDFYLQSHGSRLGTARSGHYVVLEDEIKYSMKSLQDITNNICYTGARATNVLSVCTPARYADFLCDRLRCYMRPSLEKQHPIEYNDNSDYKAMLDKKENHDYQNDPMIWNPHSSTNRKNPWHPNMDGIMFYL